MDAGDADVSVRARRRRPLDVGLDGRLVRAVPHPRAGPAFDYAYMRQGRKRPDRLPELMAAHREALVQARGRTAGPIFLAGKSMGGRVGCHLALEEPVAGLICFGFPLVSASGKRRDEVLIALRTPILLVQGTRDPLCPLDLLAQVRPRMKAPTTLLVVEGGDHSLAVSAAQRKATSTTQADADRRVLEAVQSFVGGILVAQSSP